MPGSKATRKAHALKSTMGPKEPPKLTRVMTTKSRVAPDNSHKRATHAEKGNIPKTLATMSIEDTMGPQNPMNKVKEASICWGQELANTAKCEAMKPSPILPIPTTFPNPRPEVQACDLIHSQRFLRR